MSLLVPLLFQCHPSSMWLVLAVHHLLGLLRSASLDPNCTVSIQAHWLAVLHHGQASAGTQTKKFITSLFQEQTPPASKNSKRVDPQMTRHGPQRTRVPPTFGLYMNQHPLGPALTSAIYDFAAKLTIAVWRQAECGTTEPRL